MAYVWTAQNNKNVTWALFPIVFPSIYERGWQRGVFKVLKNDYFLVVLVVWVLFLMFFGRQRVTYIKIAQNDKNVTCSCVTNCFCFILWVGLACMSVHSYEKWSLFSIFSRLKCVKGVECYMQLCYQSILPCFVM